MEGLPPTSPSERGERGWSAVISNHKQYPVTRVLSFGSFLSFKKEKNSSEAIPFMVSLSERLPLEDFSRLEIGSVRRWVAMDSDTHFLPFNLARRKGQAPGFQPIVCERTKSGTGRGLCSFARKGMLGHRLRP